MRTRLAQCLRWYVSWLVAVAAMLACASASWAAAHQYIEQTTLLLVYQHYINNEETKADGTHPRHSFTDAEVEMFKTQPTIVSEFLWRASHFRLHVKYVGALVITDTLTEADIDEEWISAKRIHKDLTDNGYDDDSFNLIMVVWPLEATEKYGTWAGGLPGATKGDVYLPKTRLDVSMYGPGRDISEAHWTILHEHQHVLDDWFGGASGLGWGEQEYRNPDAGAWAMPWPVDNGGTECFLATYEVSARNWKDWLILGKEGDTSGTQKVLPDNDGDGLPDSDPDNCGISLTEATFKTDPTKADTDGDGVSDKDEAIGDYTGSLNGTAVDTDGDGLLDGADWCPRYPSINTLPRKMPKIDGTINGDEYALFSTFRRDEGLSGVLYAAWNDGVLFLAASITDGNVVTGNARPEDNDGVQWLLDIDGDGWDKTKDLGMLNYMVWVTQDKDGKAVVSLRERLNDDGQPLSNAGIVAAFKRRDDGYDVEVAVPERALVGATFKHGRGFRMAQHVLDADGAGRAEWCDTTLPNVNFNYPMYAPYLRWVGLDGGPEAQKALAGTRPPMPSPATFAVAPHRVGDSIVMKATPGSGPNGPIEYCFVECTGEQGRRVRGWSTDPNFEVKGVGPGEYCYVVYMRNALGAMTQSGPAIVPEQRSSDRRRRSHD
ncbi:MAG: hypothetical protein JW889_13090 [Verrucomicrobia bacterium]|nr:hypothetical protein [Verrucomicrobiota bacterium]